MDIAMRVHALAVVSARYGFIAGRFGIVRSGYVFIILAAVIRGAGGRSAVSAIQAEGPVPIKTIAGNHPSRLYLPVFYVYFVIVI